MYLVIKEIDAVALSLALRGESENKKERQLFMKEQ